MKRVLAAVVLLAAWAAPGVASAHPLGNFTVNHYSRIEPAADAIRNGVPGGRVHPDKESVMRFVVALGSLVVAASVFAQVKYPPRFAIEADPDAFPQATAKDALGSVVKAIGENRIDYLLAHLADPAYVDKRVADLGGKFDKAVDVTRQKLTDDPESVKSKEVSKLGVLEHILQPHLYPDLYKDFCHVVRINYYPPRGDNKEGWDNIDIFGWMGYPMQIKIDFLCRDSILAAPIVLDLALFLDLAQRAGMHGIQEWLSFFFKSPMTPQGLYPEHDLFIQLMKLKNTLRHLRGEELITHLGTEYYD